MQRAVSLLLICTSALAASCIGNEGDVKQPTSSALAITVTPVATVTFIGTDTLSDSAQIYQLELEPDGASIAFLFADPAKGITRGLGIVQTSGDKPAQVGWPDSVLSVWWSRPHQLSFTAGTGRGVRVVVDAHAAELEAIEVTAAQSIPRGQSERTATQSKANALSRAQAFIDSIRVQPEGTPQQSALRYEADTVVVAPGDTLAAVHVAAGDPQGAKVNPAWYLLHLPTGHVQGVDSLTGRAPGLAGSAGQWGADGFFYFAKERSIWRAQPTMQ
jgi:hypothetical protein